MNYDRVAIGITAPTAELHIQGDDYDGTPNVTGTQIAEGIIELTRISSPYIDFHYGADGVDYDARIIYRNSGDILHVQGAVLTTDNQIGIGTVSSSPNGSAMLEVKSTNKGFLPPRMTNSQRDAITNPSEGLIIFNTETKCMNFYNGTQWINWGINSEPPGGGVDCPATVYDYSGNVYNTILIGNQCWMKENLNTSRYNDGSFIPNETDNATWVALTYGAYCNYNNNGGYAATYGKLYNWYAVHTGKLCPTGWHVPSDVEWVELINYLAGEEYAGGLMKEAGTSHWYSPNTGATNESGFTALPAGARWYDGEFNFLGKWANIWSSDESSSTWGSEIQLYYEYRKASYSGSFKYFGQSVRCLKD